MGALRQFVVMLAALGLVACGPAPPVVAEPPEPPVPRPTAKTNPGSTQQLADMKLALLYWPWLGERFAVTIRDLGASYQLTAQTLSAPKGANRRWTTQVAKTAELERLLSTLNPQSLAEADPCGRSWRDGTSWIVMNVVDGSKTARSRDANGSLALDQCKAFDSACRQLMQLAGIACPVGKPCLLAADRVPADAGAR